MLEKKGRYLDGKVSGISTPDGSTRSYTYDPAGRITTVENSTASGTGPTTYTPDTNGTVRTIGGAETYRYDERSRLTWGKDPGSGTIVEYSYDEVGNLTLVKEDGVPTKTLAYNGSNEITSPGYTYDQNGNMTSDGENDYHYDAANRLAEFKDHGTGQTTATYDYDYRGRRTRKTVGGTTTYYHWDANSMTAETDPSGAVKATYTYDDKGNPVSMTRNGNNYFYQTNSHGDVVTLTDSSGQVVNTYTYDPWGKVTQESETVENPIRYSGYLYDSETGMYYLMARYYDPGIGRFLTRDMLDISLMKKRSPLNFNRYAYCNDNPVSSVDKDGLDALNDKNRELQEAKEYAEEHPDDPAAQDRVRALRKELNPLMRKKYCGEVERTEKGFSELEKSPRRALGAVIVMEGVVVGIGLMASGSTLPGYFLIRLSWGIGGRIANE